MFVFSIYDIFVIIAPFVQNFSYILRAYKFSEAYNLSSFVSFLPQ